MEARFVFFGAMGRSGTNLLRNMLDCHPQIAAGPEFNYLEHIIKLYRTLRDGLNHTGASAYCSAPQLDQLMRDFIAHMLGSYAQRKGREIIVKKTPSNLWYFMELAHLFPDARFVHIVRDGRDVCCSHLDVGRRMIKAHEGRTLPADSPLTSAYHCGGLWTETIRFGMQICGPGSPLYESGRVITVRYVDLVTNTENELRRICDHIGVSFQAEMLRPERYQHDTYIDGIWVDPQDPYRPVSAASVEGAGAA